MTWVSCRGRVRTDRHTHKHICICITLIHTVPHALLVLTPISFCVSVCVSLSICLCVYVHFKDAALSLRALRPHVLLSLDGWTIGARSEPVAAGPAPIQINTLGFPGMLTCVVSGFVCVSLSLVCCCGDGCVGTMGAPFLPFIIADKIMSPPHLSHLYSEKLVLMPHSCLGNSHRLRFPNMEVDDSKRPALGLPPRGAGFVFCQFGCAYKVCGCVCCY